MLGCVGCENLYTNKETILVMTLYNGTFYDNAKPILNFMIWLNFMKHRSTKQFYSAFGDIAPHIKH
jgi:hypothetical protein